MPADLTNVRSSLDWAADKIAALRKETDAHCAAHPVKVTEHADQWTASKGQADARFYVVDKEQNIPDAFPHEIGGILNAQRGALDRLIFALSMANGGKDVHRYSFPIADSENEFRRWGANRMAALTDIERAKVGMLKPWKGGNEALYRLNWMNNEAKHRELVTLLAKPRELRIAGNGAIRRFALWNDGIKSIFPDGEACAHVEADPGIRIEFDSFLGFDGMRHHVCDDLTEFNNAVKIAIGPF
jgi:hypothetical protein